jgi:hypothetical protein
LGHIWPSDLDRLSVQFVKNRRAKGLPINTACWEESLIQLLSRTECKCASRGRCSKKCILNQSWSPPNHIQFLAKNLIDASSIRFGNILQKSTAISNVINTHGADRMWGSFSPNDVDCPQDNYYYAPNTYQYEQALRSAACHKENNIIDKSLGVVQLTPEVKDYIKEQKLSLIVTIPARAIHLFPSHFTKTPIKKSTSSYDIGIVMAIANDKKTVCESKIILNLNILQNWKQRFCPSAIIHERRLVQELSDNPYEHYDLSKENWNKQIERQWDWIHSSTGTQGIFLKKDFDKVQALKGSKKYNAMYREIALKLFCEFAKDWENKQALVPQHAKSWYHQNHYKEEKLKARKRQIKAEIKKQKHLELEEKAIKIQQRKELRLLLKRKKSASSKFRGNLDH